jgi:site-specific recombinase XerD
MTRPQTPSFWQIARGFLHDHCVSVRRLSPHTIDAYTTGLESFISYLGTCGISRPDISFTHITRANVKGWATWLRDTKKAAPKTIELRLTALTTFLKHAAAEDITLGAVYEDAASVKPPRIIRQPIEYLTQPATTAILSAHQGSTTLSRRNRTLLIFLYDSAARVSEAAGVTLSDLHLDRAPFVSLLGKGGKRRNMPLMGKTVDHLNIHLSEFHPSGCGDPPLFYSRHQGKPTHLSTDTITMVLNQATDQARLTCADIPDRVYPHLLRKTRAMDLYQEGVPLPLIMQMLGHESMATTSGFYAFATQQMMADAIRSATPPTLNQPPQWKDQTTIDALYSL